MTHMICHRYCILHDTLYIHFVCRLDEAWEEKSGFAWPDAGNRPGGPESNLEELRAGSGSSGGQESTASTLPCQQQDEEWKLEENSEEEEEEEEEERRQSQSSCPSTTTSSVLVAAPGHLNGEEGADEDVARDRSEEMSDVESGEGSDSGEDSVARLRAWLEMHRR